MRKACADGGNRKYVLVQLPEFTAEGSAAFQRQILRLPSKRQHMLDEVLLKNGFMLDYTLVPQPAFTKNDVMLAKDAHKESLVCLDGKIEAETVDYLKTHKEHFFICLEFALDTTKKWNPKHNLGEKLKAL
jgi:hypothetical protein